MDRAVYVSRGRGLEGLLTDHRIDQVRVYISIYACICSFNFQPRPDAYQSQSNHPTIVEIQVINDARELLRRGEWDAGVLLAVQQLEAWILQGPPGFWERHSGTFCRCS